MTGSQPQAITFTILSNLPYSTVKHHPTMMPVAGRMSCCSRRLSMMAMLSICSTQCGAFSTASSSPAERRLLSSSHPMRLHPSGSNARQLLGYVPTRRRTSTSLKSDANETAQSRCPRTWALRQSMDEDLPYAERTLSWLEDSVIGLNLCPFADRPYQLGNLKIRVVRGTDQVEILTSALAECFIRQDKPGTTLIVCPDLFPHNFEAFLEVYNMLQDGVLVDNKLDTTLQVAPFHPKFQFQDADPDDIENWTNRSPYPIFHILREEEVSVAVEALDGDSSKVWQRNMDLLEEFSEEHGENFVANWIENSAEAEPDKRAQVRAFVKAFSKGKSNT